MRPEQIAARLAPFAVPLSEKQTAPLALYLDLLLRWNARMNLTAVRDPEHIVTRHFGESLWSAARLLAAATATVIDVGSGAGFPGLPLKIFAPDVRLTLIESQNKKATFLKEVVRTLGLEGVDVYTGRAEHYDQRAELVTFRAVEKFDSVLPVAASLLTGPGSRLGLLVGREQHRRAEELISGFSWNQAGTVPLAADRILLIGTKLAMNQEGQ
jgi:16S rRNA (guanine527-N7)-methyltransferase